MNNIDSYDKEIATIIKTEIYDKQIQNELFKSVNNSKGHLARIIADELTDKFPHNRSYKRLYDLILNKFF